MTALVSAYAMKLFVSSMPESVMTVGLAVNNLDVAHIFQDAEIL